MIKINKPIALMIISFMILSNIAFAESNSPSEYEGKAIDESREGIDYHREGNIIVYPARISSEEKERMERFERGDLSEEEMRAMAREKFGDKFNEMEFEKGMLQAKDRISRKDTFSYEHEGFQGYYIGPSYEGYSREHMIFGMIFGLIGDDIDPREIKQYCNDPNKIADMIIEKLKGKVGDLQNVCSSISEQESKCEEYSKRGCSQIGTPAAREGASEIEKINAVAYSCPVNSDAIIEACKKRNKMFMEHRTDNIEQECKKRFDLQGEQLARECQKFKENVICDREKYISRCMGGIKEGDFESAGSEKFRYSKWQCHDGYTDSQGSETSCKSSAEWNELARKSCEGRCNADKTKCGVNSFSVDGNCGQLKEQVKCVFENSDAEQKCYTDDGRFGCSGAGTCIADVSGEKGKKLAWKSSCGGYAYTIIDGINDYANFNCGTAITECRITGCSSQICSTEHVTTTCEYRPEYECYKLYGKCARQSDGKCGWTQTDGLSNCIREKTSITTTTSTQTNTVSTSTSATDTTTCPQLTSPSPDFCTNGSIVTKYNDKGCVTGYECVTITTSTTDNSITGGVVSSTYDDLLRSCENGWTQQQRVCQNSLSTCDKESFIQRCREQGKKSFEEYTSQIDVRCKSEAASQISFMQERCSRTEQDRQRCMEESAKRCSQMEGLAEQCTELMTEENLKKFIVEEVTKRCRFTGIIENEDQVRQADKAGIILAVLNTATEDDMSKLKLYVEDLEKELELQDTTVYKGTINPSSFGDIKLLPFVVNAKISTSASSERSKEVKTSLVASQKAEDSAGALVSLRDSDVPDEYLYLIEDQASDVLNVSDELEEVEKKDDEKGFGYKLRRFFGLARAAEKKEIKQLDESKAKLSTSIEVLAKLSDEVPSDVAKAILKEQVENLKLQQSDIDALIQSKEKKSKGLFGIFG